MIQWFTDNWQLIALVGGLGLVNVFALLLIGSKLTPSTTDDQWAAYIGAIVAKAVKLTPTTSDDELLAKIQSITDQIFAAKK